MLIDNERHGICAYKKIQTYEIYVYKDSLTIKITAENRIKALLELTMLSWKLVLVFLFED